MSATGTLSVCVIQFTSRTHLVRCLESLEQQADTDVEVLVPHDDGFEDATSLRERFPAFSFLGLSGRRTPAELRASAARVARGDIIAFLEDHCVPAPDWITCLRDAHAAPHAAVGGAVEKGFAPGQATDSALNWAVYFTDYSRYMNPQSAGPARSLTDCNVSYKREALEAIRDTWQTEFHENVVNGLLTERGGTLWLAPGVVVLEQRSLTLGSALRDRYSFGRLFASTRVSGVTVQRRAVFAAGALAMPPVLVLRVARNLVDRRRHLPQFVRALPHLLLVTGTWMLGEFVGYVSGAPAASLAPAQNDSSSGVAALGGSGT